jgi:hypothetical protein
MFWLVINENSVGTAYLLISHGQAFYFFLDETMFCLIRTGC